MMVSIAIKNNEKTLKSLSCDILIGELCDNKILFQEGEKAGEKGAKLIYLRDCVTNRGDVFLKSYDTNLKEFQTRCTLLNEKKQIILIFIYTYLQYIKVKNCT